MTSQPPADPPSQTPDPSPHNRLAAESSPYLLLHAHNPVDWYPWGEEAFARARAEQRPIFLSVGYSTCYWCHVMERESFSDPEIAAAMNATFVNVKVDREERPDVDEIYMAATQILTGQGGWPNSVFLTPDLRPFYAGTYFPPSDRYGRPGFGSLVAALGDAWANRRDEVLAQAEELAEVLRRSIEERAEPADAAPDAAALARATARSRDLLVRRFDPGWGGFGTAPKFPSVANLDLLEALAGEGDADAAAMLATTYDRMLRGGIYDQLVGGFHRYATDREWRVPHFEKMLYDQGLLLGAYARHHARTGDPEAARVVRETAAFLSREMTAPEGFLWSAIDAETDGHEGAYYVWTRAELNAALGREDADFAAPLLGFAGAPFFEQTHYVLHLPLPLADLAAQRRLSRETLLAELDPLRVRLLAARDARQRPNTDDKILADWNGLAIAGLADAGRLLGEPALVEQAARAADALLTTLRPAAGPLLHGWRAGRPSVPALLADYAYLGWGLLALAKARAAPDAGRYLAAAVALAEEAAVRLGDGGGGFFAAAASPDLLARSRDLFDAATPSSYATMVRLLVGLARSTGDARWRDRAAAALAAIAGLLDRQPEAARSLLVAARELTAAGVPSKMVPSAPLAGAAASAVAHPGPPPPADLVRAAIDLGPPADDGWRPFALTLAIADGWHLNAPPAAGSETTNALGLATLELRGVDGVTVGDLRLPAGSLLEGAEPPVPVYRGRVSLTGSLRAAWPGRGRLVVAYQACDDRRCLAPAELTVLLTS